MRQQLDLCRKHARQLEQLEQQQQLEREQLAAHQVVQLEQLKKRHVVELVDLWQGQGRQLGAWTSPVLEGTLPRAFPRGGKVGHG